MSTTRDGTKRRHGTEQASAQSWEATYHWSTIWGSASLRR